MRTQLSAVLAAIALAACNGEAPVEEPAEPATGDGDTVEIDVVMGDNFYQPDGAEIPAGTMLVVHVTNEGAQQHDFELEDADGTGLVDPGDSVTAELGPFDASTVAFCTVPGHREAGMEFDITVTD